MFIIKILNNVNLIGVFMTTLLLSSLYTSITHAKDKFDEYGDMLENDMINPFEGDPDAIAVGYERFNQRCSYCHGMRGIGAKGPPLTRGYYKVSGGTNMNLYSTIAAGLTINGKPTQMGAFGATISDEDIWKIIAYMRQEYKDRKAAGSEFKYGVYP